MINSLKNNNDEFTPLYRGCINRNRFLMLLGKQQNAAYYAKQEVV